jgi:hypothetical protein
MKMNFASKTGKGGRKGVFSEDMKPLVYIELRNKVINRVKK